MIKTDYPTRRLKYAATINDEALGEATAPDFELQYIDIGNVDSSGTIHDIATYRFEDAPSRSRRRVRDGDVIVSTVRTYLQAIAPIIEPPENLIVSTGFAVVRPQSGDLFPDFCRYALREPEFLAEVVRRSVGVSYPAINASDLGDIRIPLPSLDRQRAIAAYLDRETAKLDAMVAAKERLLALLAEKRRAMITHAVTRGLNPDAPMKDSGVEWLGEVPKHWELKRLKFIGTSTIGLTFDPKSLVGSESDDGTLVLRASNVQNQRVVLDNSIYVSMDVPYELITRVDDILICSRSGSRDLIGKNALIDAASAGLAFGAFMTVFRSDANAYLFYLFNSPVFEYQASAFSTSTINQLTIETLSNMVVPVPPKIEQGRIVEHLKEATATYDALMDRTKKSITLLRERRSALIAAAVTGAIDVEVAA